MKVKTFLDMHNRFVGVNFKLETTLAPILTRTGKNLGSIMQCEHGGHRTFPGACSGWGEGWGVHEPKQQTLHVSVRSGMHRCISRDSM